MSTVCRDKLKGNTISNSTISARNNSWPFSDQFQHLANQNPF